MSDAFIHSSALCETPYLGSGTRVWAFAHILPGAVIGADCNVCDGVFIENDVIIGDRVTIKSGVQVWDGVRLDDDVFVGPNATFTNDVFPRSRQWQPNFPITRVCSGASIGANATVLPGVTIGRGAMIGAGSVVTKDVPANAVVYGNPAQIHRYATTAGAEAKDSPPSADALGPRLAGTASVVRLSAATDMRGSLVAIEYGPELPFEPRRSFFVYGVPSSQVRGEHAHRQCHQVLIALSGSVQILLDDGSNRSLTTLDDPSVGLHIPPMHWASQFNHSDHVVLAVLASHHYDPDDYIRDYEAFLLAVRGGG